MYFLAKVCRICVSSGGDLHNIDSRDYDSIRIRDKLEAFAEMNPHLDAWSAFICGQCVGKLRISYEFDRMCKRSPEVLRQYLTELMCDKDDDNTDKFVNSELRVQVRKIPSPPRPKRKYIKRESRCLMLKNLLIKIGKDKAFADTKPILKPRRTRVVNPKTFGGGLRPLVQYARCYNFGYKIEVERIENTKFDKTHVERLTDFVNTYFNITLNSFHDRLTCVLDDTDKWFDDYDDLQEMLQPSPEIDPRTISEEMVIEPDINIKREIMDDTYDEGMQFEVSYPCSSTSPPRVKLEHVVIKAEPDAIIPPHCAVRTNADMYPTLCETLSRQSQSSLNLLQQFAEGKFPAHRFQIKPKPLPVKRPRSPFIRPELKRQFLLQDFKCGVCHRKFKSQGFLQAHYSKMMHRP